MSEKLVWMRDQATFKMRLTYRELTYKLASRLVEKDEDDSIIEGVLRAAAAEVDPEVLDIADMVHNKLGLPDYELSKVETFVMPLTLNTVWRGIAKKGDHEVRFYVERP
jgi:hypothetical protein